MTGLTTTTSAASFPLLIPQNPVALSGDRLKEYVAARNKARNLSDTCKKFLQGLGIENPNDVLGALGKQRAFDGMASTLSLDAAGLQKGNPLSVAEAFGAAKEDREKGIIGPLYAMTAIEGGDRTRYNVYFSDMPITADTVLHEAIHSLTKLDDDALAKAAGVTKIPKGSSSSEEFNKALVKNCF